MTPVCSRIPPGPVQKCNTSQDLLKWLQDQFEAYGDIYRASIYGSNAYVINAPQYLDHVLRRNWQNYKKGQAIKRIGFLLGNGLMVSEGEFWKSQRRMIQPVFHDKAIVNLINVITKANVNLLSKWTSAAEQNLQVNITSDISEMILEIVLVAIFGDDYGEVASHFAILSRDSARDLEFAQAFRPLRDIVGRIIAERRKLNKSATDMIGMLIAARDAESGKEMPDSQLVSEVMTLIVAGHETTASTLNWVWYLLSENSDVEEKLSEELWSTPCAEMVELNHLSKFTYTRQVIEETLRLYPAGWLMTRKALKDDQIGEYFVPAGTEIYISPYIIQRHPALWETPDRFIPERFEPGQSRSRHELTMLPFSAGPRKCIGEMLARVEMQIHLMIIARRLRFRRTSNEPVELDVGVNLRSKHDFIMTPTFKREPATQFDQLMMKC
jgi:cytochrome P450